MKNGSSDMHPSELSDKINELQGFQQTGQISDVSPSGLKDGVKLSDAGNRFLRTKTRVDHLFAQKGEGKTGLQMFTVDDKALNDY